MVLSKPPFKCLKVSDLIKLVPEDLPTIVDFESAVLYGAVCLNDISLVKRLLLQNPSLGWRESGSFRNPDLEARLDIAVYHGNLEMIKLLLSADPTLANPAAPLPANLFSVIVHCRHNDTKEHRDIFRFAMNMSDIGTNSSNFTTRWTGYHEATENAMCYTPFPDVFERAAEILGLGNEIFSPPKSGKNLLFNMLSSARRGHIEMVRYCLERGVSPNGPFWKRDVKNDDLYPDFTSDCSPLLLSVKGGHFEVANLLLESGADPNWYAFRNTPLQATVHRGDIRIAQLLLDHGAKLDEGYPPPIVIAVRNENMEMFTYLRSKGAALDSPDTGPCTLYL